jgi:hypothetical protein
MNSFEKLSKIDVSGHVEKKGQFDYLSWTFAVSELRKAEPQATWKVKLFETPEGTKPFMATECGYFVEVAVTVGEVTLSQVHPVLNNSNKAVGSPDAFQINTSIQRCLVKAIALHGLGLSVYTGEDLPPAQKKEEKKEKKDDSGYVTNFISPDEFITKINEAKAITHLENVFKKYWGSANHYTEPQKERVIKAKDDKKFEFEVEGKKDGGSK